MIMDQPRREYLASLAQRIKAPDDPEAAEKLQDAIDNYRRAGGAPNTDRDALSIGAVLPLQTIAKQVPALRKADADAAARHVQEREAMALRHKEEKANLEKELSVAIKAESQLEQRLANLPDYAFRCSVTHNLRIPE
jgi:hypothetical protein